MKGRFDEFVQIDRLKQHGEVDEGSELIAVGIFHPSLMVSERREWLSHRPLMG
jgi:hypothetical protein